MLEWEETRKFGAVSWVVMGKMSQMRVGKGC